MFAEDKSWPDMKALECPDCTKERAARDRVVKSDEDPRFFDKPFDDADPPPKSHNMLGPNGPWPNRPWPWPYYINI